MLQGHYLKVRARERCLTVAGASVIAAALATSVSIGASLSAVFFAVLGHVVIWGNGTAAVRAGTGGFGGSIHGVDT